ncbi:MAG: glutathione ABC transporter ATP-binding protein [Azospirillum brasilense]|nr:MAG: glutathione ABC transporter ATP-binding protein [Azospirillum brasilense]
MTALLDIRALSVAVTTPAGALPVTDSLSLSIAPGETVCLVGESGSGKTVTALSVMRLMEHRGGSITAGEIWMEGRNLTRLSQREMSALRGRRIGIIFQEPMTAFDPLVSIGAQIGEVLRRHQGLSRRGARQAAITLLRRVRIPDAPLRVDQLPHQLSGGMRQRAMIAMALACNPALLIADEPTTALDVTIQAQILELLRELQAETGMSILLITHDLGVAAQIADRVVVLYAGRIAEDAPAAALFTYPAHPYTRGLLASAVGKELPRGVNLPAIPGGIPDLARLPSGCRFHPRCGQASEVCASAVPALRPLGDARIACWHPREGLVTGPVKGAKEGAEEAGVPAAAGEPLLTLRDVRKEFVLPAPWPWTPRRSVRAVDGVTLDIRQGETLGLVGESGCGKSTLARLLMQIETPSGGTLLLDGAPLSPMARRDMQMVFQDPFGSLDPRWTIGDLVAEPLLVHAGLSAPERRARVADLLGQVGIDPGWAGRFPHALSGGQRQRVAIARAIAVQPRFLLLDEAVSALDVSVQAQVANLLLALKQQLGLTYLFISHGLHLVRHLSDRIAVMYLGRIVELGSAEAVFGQPRHPYTRALIDAIPEPDPTRRREAAPVAGELPSPANPPPGCHFHTRCPAASELCRREAPRLEGMGRDHVVACHHPIETA